jgi:hypothetical protein
LGTTAVTIPTSLAFSERLTEEEELRGALVAREERQDVGRAELGRDAERHEGHLEARVARGVDEIAMQQHGRADADRRAADRGDDRLADFLHRDEEARRGRSFDERRALEEVADVVAGAKAVGRAAQQDDAHLRILVGAGDRVGEAAVHLAGESVLLVEAGELDECNSIGKITFDQDGSP